MSTRNNFLSDTTDDATSSHRRYHPYRRQPPISCRHTYFYFPSGNFFLRIQGWLFRIHSEIILPPSMNIQSRFHSSQTDFSTSLMFHRHPRTTFRNPVTIPLCPIRFRTNHYSTTDITRHCYNTRIRKYTIDRMPFSPQTITWRILSIHHAAN